MIIRRATDDDFDQIMAMASKFYHAARLDSIAIYDEDHVSNIVGACLNDKDKTLFVADVDGELVGMVWLALIPFTFAPSAKMAFEIAWWTEPDARGHGVGKGLFQAIESWSKEVGATHIQMAALGTSDHSMVAGIYLKQGFRLLESSYLRRV